jgi:hypothetical protein
MYFVAAKPTVATDRFGSRLMRENAELIRRFSIPIKLTQEK